MFSDFDRVSVADRSMSVDVCVQASSQRSRLERFVRGPEVLVLLGTRASGHHRSRFR